MLDYKEKMIALFQRFFCPDGDIENKKHMTTIEVLEMFLGVIPSEPVSEHDVYEILEELGYTQDRVIIYEEKETASANENLGIKRQIDLVEVGVVFKWVVFEK